MAICRSVFHSESTDQDSGQTYIGNVLHIANHIFIALSLLGQTSIVDVVIALSVHHFDFRSQEY